MDQKINIKNQDSVAVRVSHAAVRFNMASERVDNLKEYFIFFGSYADCICSV